MALIRLRLRLWKVALYREGTEWHLKMGLLQSEMKKGNKGGNSGGWSGAASTYDEGNEANHGGGDGYRSWEVTV